MSDFNCPRCDVALLTERHPSDELDLHRCNRCGGVWVDGADVGWVYPALRHHGARVEELLRRGARRETSIPRCPRGHHDAIEFPFFDLWLDLCESCHGLWLDGSEVTFASRAAREQDGLPEAALGDTPYRVAHEAPTTPRIRCSACEREVHPRRTYLTADGAVCDDCVELEELSEQMADDASLARLKRAPARLLRFLGGLLDADGKRLRRGGFTNQIL
jgi:Zn-finger nucleic acid-binding protein